MSIYFKIKDIITRKEKMSISRLEKELNFGSGTIRRWQKNDPGLEKVLRVADYLDVPITDLLPDEEKTKHEKETLLTTVEKKLKQLPLDQQENIIKDTLEYIDYRVTTINEKGTED